MESARGVIKVMSQAGLEPDTETYRALLSGYAKHGLLQDITSTLSNFSISGFPFSVKILILKPSLGECKKKDIAIHDRDLLEVLYSAAINGHDTVVDALLSQMKKLSGYNQDCFNVILRLINHRQEEQAFKVLLGMKPITQQDGQTTAAGGFFIRQIVKSNCAPEKIVSFCQRLVESGLNNRAFFRALEVANSFGRVDVANILLKQIQKQKDSLRPQAFWPLLVNFDFSNFFVTFVSDVCFLHADGTVKKGRRKRGARCIASNGGCPGCTERRHYQSAGASLHGRWQCRDPCTKASIC